MKRLLSGTFVCAVLLAACATPPKPAQSPKPVLFDTNSLPSGPLGKSIAYGRAIIMNTPALMKRYVRADMTCADCHIAGGTQARGGSFVGVYGRFPQWNRRAHRVIALQDRIAECFLYSMNGRPPGYASKEMVAIVAYIAWLSRGVAVGSAQPESDRYIEPLPGASPSVGNGRTIYATRCAGCHQPGGGGVSGTYPPLWGKLSFNRGAGMAHLDRITGFIHANMPQDAPGSLTLDQAYDVAAFILSNPHPAFAGKTLVTTPSRPAKYF
jgi:thiosulfate dehydrogenase